MSGARYHTIISLQDYQDETLEQLMADRDAEGIARHLSQWDSGEYHDEPRELGFLPDYSITGHVIPNAGSYVLMINYGLGDASLLARA